MKKHTHKKRMGITGLILALTLAAFGCAGVYVDPGPNPAKVLLDFSGSVSVAAANQALIQRGYIRDRIESWDQTLFNMNGPYWDFSLQRKNADGSLTDIRHAGEGRIRMIQGDRVKKKITFLAPPGPGQYLLLISCYLVREEGISGEWISVTVDIGGLKENLGLTLKPGETKVIPRQVNIG